VINADTRSSMVAAGVAAAIGCAFDFASTPLMSAR